MNLTRFSCGVVLAGTLAWSVPGVAAVSPQREVATNDGICDLGRRAVAAIHAETKTLARRLYLASMEAVEDPDQFRTVEREVAEARAELVTSYGEPCVPGVGRRLSTPPS